MRIVVLLAISFATCTALPDSTGTNFIFGYVRDAVWNITNQRLSVTVLNGNSLGCSFSVEYREDYDEEKYPLLKKSFTVPKMDMIEVPIPSWYGWQYDSGGLQVESGPKQLIFAQSTCPVTLIANNYDNVTQQGDSYLVLPIRWAKSGPVYAFTLPPASNDVENPGYQHISIIPTEDDVKGTLTVFGSDPLPFTARPDGPTTYFMTKTPKGKAHAYHIQADGPILILAGVTCAGSYKACDHAAFMPQPLPTPTCYRYAALDDNHPAYISITNGFYADIPGECSEVQQLKVSGNRGTVSKNFPLSPTKQTPLLSYDSSFGGAVNMHAETAPVHITRYHDLSTHGKQGAFIDTVASISQFITGDSTFYTRNDNDIIEVICVVSVCTSSTVDGIPMFSLEKNYTTVGLINGTNYYALSAVIPNKGFHLIQSGTDGIYAYYVVGQNQNSMYGYLGGINMPKVVLLPSSTTTLPTTKTSTLSSNSTTRTKPTTTVTTPKPSTIFSSTSSRTSTTRIVPTTSTVPRSTTVPSSNITTPTTRTPTSTGNTYTTAPSTKSTPLHTSTLPNRLTTTLASLHPSPTTAPITSSVSSTVASTTARALTSSTSSSPSSSNATTSGRVTVSQGPSTNSTPLKPVTSSTPMSSTTKTQPSTSTPKKETTVGTRQASSTSTPSPDTTTMMMTTTSNNSQLPVYVATVLIICSRMLL